MSERTYSEVMDDFRHHIAVDESVATDPEDIFAIEARINKGLADGLDAAHKREIDVLKQRCAELNAEVAAKDEVIKRLNDAIAEEQRRKMATAEKPSAVGNAAKLREATEAVLLAFNYGESTIVNRLPFSKLLPMLRKCVEALSAPPRNCDLHTADELKVIFKSELVSELPIANKHEKNLVTITAMGVIDTLFATTKKGGNNANE